MPLRGLGASKRPTRPVRGGHGERGKAAVHPDEPGIIVSGAGRVAAAACKSGAGTLRLTYQREP